MQPTPSEVTDTVVVDRADPPRSFLGTAWPLAAMGLMLLLLLRACVPGATPPSTLAAPAKSTDGSPEGAAAAADRPAAQPAPR